MVNNATLIGNIGADAEIKEVNGNALATFNLATSEKWKGANGVQERTTWHTVEVWGKLAEAVGKYLRKGERIYVGGSILVDQWEKDGAKFQKHKIKAQSIKLLGGKPAGGGATEEDHLPF